MSNYQFRFGVVAATVLACASSAAQAADDVSLGCGKIHVFVHAVAVPDSDHVPLAAESFDRVYTVPEGIKDHYGGRSEAIVAVGFPINGRPRSAAFLNTACNLTAQDDGRPTMTLDMSAYSELASGAGSRTAASAEYRTQWMIIADLPVGPSQQPWRVDFKGHIDIADEKPEPDCTIRLNGVERDVPPHEPIDESFSNVSGKSQITISCDQPSITVRPSSGTETTLHPTLKSNLTINFVRP